MSQPIIAGKPQLKIAAAIEHVQEVVLAGAAELDFWRAQLRPAGLAPYAEDGRASLLISATAARWKGLSFCELSFTVAVGEGDDEHTHGGFYLVHAYNSRRMLAFAERAFFKTPYHHGRLEVAAGAPARIELIEAGAPAFVAALGGGVAPSWSGDDSWAGPIYLPGGRGPAPGPLFYARLAGHTQLFPFDPARDTLTIHPAARAPIFGQLRASGFAAREWRIRASASHAKSQTYAAAV